MVNVPRYPPYAACARRPALVPADGRQLAAWSVGVLATFGAMAGLMAADAFHLLAAWCVLTTGAVGGCAVQAVFGLARRRLP